MAVSREEALEDIGHDLKRLSNLSPEQVEEAVDNYVHMLSRVTAQANA